MAERPVWWEATDEASMLQLLRDAATLTTLDVTPRPAPKKANAALLHRAAVALAKERVVADHTGQDRALMEEVKALDDLVRAANLLVERLREWHALTDADTVRSAADAAALVQRVKDAAPDAETHADDHAVLLSFADALGAVQSSWRAIEERVAASMQELAPNTTSIIGPLVGARLLTLAGGLQRLAMFPAGTVQTLGAETALFRAIKEGAKPPKHGILYQHPLVFQAPPWQRGSVSRVLANHLVLAARADATTGRDLTEHLQTSLDADLASIRSKKAKPPVRGPPKGGKGGRGGPRGKPGRKGGPRGPKRGPRKGPGGKGGAP